VAEIPIASQLIAKLIFSKAYQGKKLNNYEYIILLIYCKMMYADKRFTELNTTDERFEEADRRYGQEVDKKFESLKSEIKEIKKEINEINAKLDTIEARLDKIEKEIKELKDLMTQALALMNQLVLASKTS